MSDTVYSLFKVHTHLFNRVKPASDTRFNLVHTVVLQSPSSIICYQCKNRRLQHGMEEVWSTVHNIGHKLIAGSRL